MLLGASPESMVSQMLDQIGGAFSAIIFGCEHIKEQAQAGQVRSKYRIRRSCLVNLNRRDAVSTLAEALQSLARWAFHRKIGQQIRVREYQEREYFSLGAQLRIGGAPLGSSSPTPAPVADARTSTWGRGHW
jgi:hypothetical protein